MNLRIPFFRRSFLFTTFCIGIFFYFHPLGEEITLEQETINLDLGQKFPPKSLWIGNKVISPSIPILILAGHADSQAIEGAGTSGEAVDLQGLPAMDNRMTDELFWNLKVCNAVVRLGKKKGLKISFYDPGIRTILDSNDKRTNWSQGARHAIKGGYSLEIHFDAYGEYGFGSGLIPPFSSHLNNVDESLARSFGRYPLFFRGVLGGPRRQIRLLEIGKLEGPLEMALRNINTREKTIEAIANKIIEAISFGLTNKDLFNQEHSKDGIFLLKSYQKTSLEV